MPKTPKFFSALMHSKPKTVTPISTHPGFYRPTGKKFARKGRTRIRTMSSIARDYLQRMDANLKGKFFGSPAPGKAKWK
jgi:hypothetical protein